MNQKTERINMADVFKARYVLQRSDDHLIARDAVEPDNRSGNVADSFLAFRSQDEAEAFRREMQREDFKVVELPPDSWLDACREFMQEGLTYISLLELDGGTVVKKAVRLADILSTADQLAEESRHLDAFRWN
jgi:hypothetical protein